jgi:serine protease Do
VEVAPVTDEPSLPLIDAPALRPDLEKTPLTYVSDYWLQLGDRVKNKIVLIGREDTPGIMVGEGLALTSIRAAHDFLARQREAAVAKKSTRESQATATAEPESPFKLIGVDSKRNLALFELREPRAAAVFLLTDPSQLRPGVFVAAVSLGANRRLRITPGHLVSVKPEPEAAGGEGSLEVSIGFPKSMQVAAIVDLDGGLIGIAVASVDGMRVFSSAAVPDIVEGLRQSGRCRAIEVGALGEQARTLLGVKTGVLVERVRQDSFVPAPSLREGDVLLEWNSQSVNSSDEFQKLYDASEPGSLVRYRVLRKGSHVTGATVMPGLDCRPVREPLFHSSVIGMTLRWAPSEPGPNNRLEQGWRVVAVAPDSAASRAGLQPGDLIVAADDKDLRLANRTSVFKDFERRPRPMLLQVWRDERIKLIVVGADAG